jgi:mono/diheme cytochrome c family protein
MLRRVQFLIFGLALLLAARTRAADDAKNTVEAMRLLKSNCFSCHNDEKKKGGLQLTTRDGLLHGGEDGAAVDLKLPEKSALLDALAADADPHMPPKKQFTPAQVQTLRDWLKQGAPWDLAALKNVPSAPRNVALAAMPAGYQPVLALAVSPDARRLAVACGPEVVLYDLTTPQPAELARASGHQDAVQSLAWSPDGKHLASGAFRRAIIWEPEKLTVEHEITAGLTDRITALHFTPDGKQLVLGDGRTAESGIVRLVEAGSGAVTTSWNAHGDTIFGLDVSHDGKLLATAGGDKLAKVWDLATHKELGKLEGHQSQVLSVAFDEAGTRLVTGGVDQQLKVWDVAKHDQINTLGIHTTPVNAVAWIPAKATIIAATADGAAFCYNDLEANTGVIGSVTAKETKLEPAKTTLLCLAATANGERIFAVAPFAIAKPAPAAPDPRAPSFVRDVLPVLAKAGCNAGACHAKPDGQNGFRLTVFSFDPQSDYRKITEDARGRRIFPASPAESLLLLKATNTVPHEGGERFAKDSDAYRTLAHWIETGFVYRGENEPSVASLIVDPAEQIYHKGDTRQLRVRAHYTDGSERDVTALAGFASNDKEIAKVTDDGLVSAGQLSGQAVVVARYMGLVGGSRIAIPADHVLPPERYTGLPVRNFIDELAYTQFQKLGFFPSGPCTDAAFLRRASLDTIGVLPTPDEARAFLADRTPDKRDRLIDRLLANPAYADFWANKWADLLRPSPDRAGIKSVYLLDQWLRGRFRENEPMNQFARDIVLAEGNTHRLGPAVIYRDRREPADLTTMFSQLFLGVRLDCAKCHHHPNEKWGQDDFYRLAACFGALHQRGAGISAPISAGNETFYFVPGRTVKHPVTGEVLEPKAPESPEWKLAATDDPRLAFANWLTAPENPFFSHAIVNRVWAAFFGRGIVEPVDDFRLSNPPSNPALLDALANELTRDHFDLKALMRTILRSHLYQLSDRPNDTNLSDTRNFSRSYRRRLPAETIADALSDVTGVPSTFPGMPPGSRAMQAWTFKIDSQTMDAFGRPNASSDSLCERDTRPSIVQSLHLMNSRLLQEKLSSPEGRVHRLVASSASPQEIVTELYLTCYGRNPSPEELSAATAPFAAEEATRQSATEDVFWSLLNSAEFVFNH